jgi:hypothetical protein
MSFCAAMNARTCFKIGDIVNYRPEDRILSTVLRWPTVLGVVSCPIGFRGRLGLDLLALLALGAAICF